MKSAVCIASGPSLTAADVQIVQQWRAAKSDRLVIVTNSTFQIAPWADYLYGLDEQWWRRNLSEAKQVFQGRMVSNCATARQLGIDHVQTFARRFEAFQNSGAAAVSLACRMGCDRVVMLGYDAQKTGGRAHWHDDHKGLPNAHSIPKWNARFRALRSCYPKVQIINASRETALNMFPRASLEQALSEANP